MGAVRLPRILVLTIDGFLSAQRGSACGSRRRCITSSRCQHHPPSHCDLCQHHPPSHCDLYDIEQEIRQLQAMPHDLHTLNGDMFQAANERFEVST